MNALSPIRALIIAIAAFTLAQTHVTQWEPGWKPGKPVTIEQNPAWTVREKTDIAVLTGDSSSLATPSLIINSAGDGTRVITLTIESDARSLRIARSGTRIDLGAIKTGSVVALSFDADDPWVSVDGVKNPALTGAWLQLLGQRRNNFEAQFVGATYVTVHFANGQPAPTSTGTTDNKSAPTPVIAPTTPSVTTPAVPSVTPVSVSTPTPASVIPITSTSLAGAAADRFAAARAAVFELRVRDGASSVFASGTGFRIAGTPYAVTNFHVVRSAQSGVAVFNDSHTEMETQRLCLDPRLFAAMKFALHFLFAYTLQDDYL